MLNVKLQPSHKDLLVFSALLVPFSFLLGWVIGHTFSAPTLGWWINGILLVIGVVGLVRPGWVKWFFVGWTALFFPIGWLISHTVLFATYFGVFMPFGLIARCFGYDPLQTRISDLKSYWKELEPVTDKRRYFRQF